MNETTKPKRQPNELEQAFIDLRLDMAAILGAITRALLPNGHSERMEVIARLEDEIARMSQPDRAMARANLQALVKSLRQSAGD